MKKNYEDVKFRFFKEKYTILKEKEHSLEFDGVVLHRIMYNDGRLGGYVENETNLSQNGSCGIYDDAKVYNGGRVIDDACIYDNAVVKNNAVITDNATMVEDSVISGNVVLGGSRELRENEHIRGTENTEYYV